jgi:hypothetical protein
MDLELIQKAIASGNYQYSLHAVQRTTERHISRSEIERAISRAEIIEDYPQDKYGPSCLLYGDTDNGRALHIQVSLPPLVKIITVYEPDPKEWENNRVRKSV